MDDDTYRDLMEFRGELDVVAEDLKRQRNVLDGILRDEHVRRIAMRNQEFLTAADPGMEDLPPGTWRRDGNGVIVRVD